MNQGCPRIFLCTSSSQWMIRQDIVWKGGGGWDGAGQRPFDEVVEWSCKFSMNKVCVQYVKSVEVNEDLL